MKISQFEGYNSPFTNSFSISDRNSNSQKSKSFKGGLGDAAFSALDKVFYVLDKNAMVQVSCIDAVTTIIPRTVFDAKTSLAASLETFRRESSGLIVNCLMPGFIVKGIAEILPKSKILEGTDVASSWANADSAGKLKNVYLQAQKSGKADITKEYVRKALTSLRGLDGKTWVEYSSKAGSSEFEIAVDDVANAVSKKGDEQDKLLKQAKAKLVNLTKAENILQFDKKPHSNLEETLRDIVDLGAKFNSVKNKAILSNGEIPSEIKKYTEELKSFVNKKSLIGLGIVMSIAVSMQSINRAITRKQFKTEGAPIYKDFGKKNTSKKMDEKQKKEFLGKKLLAAVSMYALAGLSMMKKPTLGMFQFTGRFPTLDQCRWIAAATFASRMLASEDENELRETTVRDLASFAGLYFLGDYAKKGAASVIEAFSKTKTGKNLIGENVVLLNRKKEAAKPNNGNIIEQVKYRIKQFGNWIKNTELKTANEVSSTKIKNLRNLCRSADIGFSLVILGILLPSYSRKITEKKVEEAKKQEEMKKMSLIQKMNTPKIFQNMS